jgi:hypothetical protein
MMHSPGTGARKLFLFRGKAYTLPAERIHHANTPVTMAWKDFESSICGWRSVPFSIDAFLGAANMKGRGYAAKNIVCVDTTAGWVWGSSLRVELDEEARLLLGIDDDEIGTEILCPWPAAKACHAWESAAEQSRRDSIYRALVDFEPTRSIISPFPLNPDTIPDAVEILGDELSVATRTFLSCTIPLQTLAIPRNVADNYVAKVLAHVEKKQSNAEFRRPPEKSTIDRILANLPERGKDGRIDWLDPKLDRILSADSLNARRRTSERCWKNAHLAKSLLPSSASRKRARALSPPRTPERGASSSVGSCSSVGSSTSSSTLSSPSRGRSADSDALDLLPFLLTPERTPSS